MCSQERVQHNQVDIVEFLMAQKVDVWVNVLMVLRLGS